MESTTHSENIKKHVKAYIAVFAALAALTVVTVAISYLHLPIGPAVGVALFIAVIKGSLVASYFMHLISEKKVIYALLILTLVFLIALLFLPLSSFFDQEGNLVS
jgi:cytochrome c oxidase subunit 4